MTSTCLERPWIRQHTLSLRRTRRSRVKSSAVRLLSGACRVLVEFLCQLLPVQQVDERNKFTILNFFKMKSQIRCIRQVIDTNAHAPGNSFTIALFCRANRSTPSYPRPEARRTHRNCLARTTSSRTRSALHPELPQATWSY
ncbi:hypothetical protein PC129_g11335 [Phytophthora cactorum]|uniref:Uncharacterized protein n=1 Tax=Phytophthora cactorum TaxID=29920 RepID=A0A8T1I1W3_9STRA|nr:hypothetical protein PC119_g16834 [Phytophthora cactorum]KAG3009796.1 hypothetical protein PC120_g15456 [Phytophthora cactorum]KAG3217848.1 hypothetical protein PC129_g11335 [Phytophthora cactorum]KAG4048810.1 hypothetical protein PC123_g15898 [Phytophthora cactorum]